MSDSSPRPARSRSRTILLAVGGILGVLIILAIAGNLIGEPENTAANPVPSSTTAATTPTTTTPPPTTTTVAPPPTTTTTVAPPTTTTTVAAPPPASPPPVVVSSAPRPNAEQSDALYAGLLRIEPGFASKSRDTLISRSRNQCSSILEGLPEDRLISNAISRFTTPAISAITQQQAFEVNDLIRSGGWCQ